MRSGLNRVGGEVLVSDIADVENVWPALSVLPNGDVVTARLDVGGGTAASIKIRVSSDGDGADSREGEICLAGDRPSDVYRDIVVTPLAGGSLVVSWIRQSYQADAEWAVALMAQEFDSAARPRCEVFAVNTNSTGTPKHCSMTPLSQGGCVIVWSDERCQGGSDVRAAFVSPETRASRSRSDALPAVYLTCSDSGRSADRPVVSARPEGSFLALWHEGHPGGDLKGRLFDAAAWPQSPEFTIQTARGDGAYSGDVVAPALAVLSGSRFVVSWIESRPGVESAQPQIDLLARVFSESGLPRGEAFVVRSSFDPLIGNPSVAALAGGGFVIAWEVQDPEGTLGVRAQAFSASGHPMGTEVSCAGTGIDPRLHPLADGGFLLSWAASDGMRMQRIRIPSIQPDLEFIPYPAGVALCRDEAARSSANQAARR